MKIQDYENAETSNIDNKETLEAIEESIEMMKNPNKYKAYENVDELMETLNSTDE